MIGLKTYEQDNDLLEALAANDANAIETIYRDNYSAIKAFIIKNNGYADDARDIFQEAMIIIFEKAKSGSFVLSCRLQTYLYSVCRRLWLKKLQNQHRFNPSFELNHEIVPVDEELELHEQKEAEFQLLENAIQKIGEACKSLLEALYIQ